MALTANAGNLNTSSSYAANLINFFSQTDLKNAIGNQTPYSGFNGDGRFGTLSECIDHYTKVKSNVLNLDPLLQNNVMSFSAQDKEDIIAFLNTLTDYKFINDKRFSNPNK